MNKTAYLALGANIGDREANLREAVRRLRESGCKVTAVSSLYLTKPVGVLDQPDFINAVIGTETALAPHDLLRLCRSIEETLGRERTIRWGPRVIDIDILLYEGAVVDEPELVLPHPRMLERAFVLVPLAEIAPELELVEGLTARQAADRIDRSGVELAGDASWSD
jgi:2-amino-4-hydroxy-6-hydroxymethyldihydropteridine diphosphokinase